MEGRKNEIVLKMVETMLSDSKLNKRFWCQGIATIVHMQNRGLLRLVGPSGSTEKGWGGESILDNFIYF